MGGQCQNKELVRISKSQDKNLENVNKQQIFHERQGRVFSNQAKIMVENHEIS